MTTKCPRCDGPCCHLECPECEKVHCLLYDCGERGRMVLSVFIVVSAMIVGGVIGWWIVGAGK